eukprot:sb/3462555/
MVVVLCVRETLKRRCGMIRRFVSRSGKPPPPHQEEESAIRNIGIVAHVDAGKTSVTERILVECGALRTAGSIKHGTTTTDYLQCERDRGITVNSAFVQTTWNNHTINIIDTPGHLDFNFEVERCLRVLDAAVLVIDGVQGVEAQTVTVWNQLRRYRLPCLIFINKCDRESSSVERCLEDIREELGVEPILLNTPTTTSTPKYTLTGVEDQRESEEVRELLMLADSKFEGKFSGVPGDQIPPWAITRSLRYVNNWSRNDFVLVCVGSAITGVGVSEFLNHVTELHPSPRRTFSQLPAIFQESNSSAVCGVVFKSSRDSRNSVFCQSRVYAGKLKLKEKLFNLRSRSEAHVSGIWSNQAGHKTELSSLGMGEICMISGCEDFRTGDVFVSSGLKKKIDQEMIEKYRLLDSGLDQHREPLFFANIEADTAAETTKLTRALEQMSFEDPTLEVKEVDDGVIVVGGMGELHLSIVRDRLRSEHGVDCRIRKIRVNFQEALEESFVYFAEDDVIGSIQIEMESILPARFNKYWLHVNNGVFHKNLLQKLNSSVQSAMCFGPLVGHSVSGASVKVTIWPVTHTSLLKSTKSEIRPFKRAMDSVMRAAIRENKSKFVLSEPIANFTVEGPNQLSAEVLSHYNTLVSNPDGARLSHYGPNYKNFRMHARAPLAQLLGYPGKLGKLTKGRATLTSLKVGNYHAMDREISEQTVRNIKLGLC